MAQTMTKTRSLPPFLSAAVLLMLVLAVLPSALNLPQSNPATTLEYAPVPPADDTNPPPTAGNLASLGLAGSSTLSAAIKSAPNAADLAPPSAGAPTSGGKNPTSKRCVGNPPRQSEDPSSPPCVAYFSGDNFGATYTGVTNDEIRVVVYFEGCGSQLGGSRGRDALPCNAYVDMAQPPIDNEDSFSRSVRVYQRYFNERFQTYGRFVHFWAYFDAGGNDTVEGRRADAADNIAKIHPFAAMIGSAFAYQGEWENYMAKRGVVVFRNAQTERGACCIGAATFKANAPRFWAAAASTELYSPIISRGICSRVVGRPVSFSGMPADQGKPRKLGIIINRRDGFPEEARHGDLVRAQVESCGGQFVAEGVNDGSENSADKAALIAADFQNKGVTTVVWPAGPSPAGTDAGGLVLTNAFGAINYYPEVVVSGSGGSEITLNGQVLNQRFWQNAFAFTPFERADVAGERPCFQAAREADPAEPELNIQNFDCPIYPLFRLLFTGIQVAGPRLGPTSLDKGFHAIPAVASNDVRVAACYFEPGDYTCNKDVMIEYWDPAGQDPGTGSKGCMRMVEGGQRYIVKQFPDLDIAANKHPDDPCNRQGIVVA